MVRSKFIALQLLISGALVFFGCTKSATWNQSSNGSLRVPPAYLTDDQSLSPYYGDSVLYGNPGSRTPYLISPVNHLGAGHFVGWPAGILLDAQTGVIDLQHSEPGASYYVGFVSDRTHDTAYRLVTLSGITYPYAIHIMDQGDTLMTPWYNAASAGIDYVNLFRSGSGSSVDLPGPGGQTASSQGLVIDPSSGNVNLLQSLGAGLFGSNPQNGATREVSIYYRLSDRSNLIVQRTTVILHYFYSLNDVPQLYRNMAQSTLPPLVIQTFATSNNGKRDSSPPPPPPTARPPHIVIVNTGRH